VRNCSTDEGRPLGIGLQEQVPNPLRRLCSKGKVVNRELEQRIGSVYEHARLATLNSGAAKPPDDFGPSAEEMLRSTIEGNHQSFLSAADRFPKACKSLFF